MPKWHTQENACWLCLTLPISILRGLKQELRISLSPISNPWMQRFNWNQSRWYRKRSKMRGADDRRVLGEPVVWVQVAGGTRWHKVAGLALRGTCLPTTATCRLPQHGPTLKRFSYWLNIVCNFPLHYHSLKGALATILAAWFDPPQTSEEQVQVGLSCISSIILERYYLVVFCIFVQFFLNFAKFDTKAPGRLRHYNWGHGFLWLTIESTLFSNNLYSFLLRGLQVHLKNTISRNLVFT